MELVLIFALLEFSVVMLLVLFVAFFKCKSTKSYLISFVFILLSICVTIHLFNTYVTYKDYSVYTSYSSVSINMRDLGLSNNKLKFIDNNTVCNLEDNTGQASSTCLDINYVLSSLNEDKDLKRYFSTETGKCIPSSYWDSIKLSLKPSGNNILLGYLTIKPLNYFFSTDISIEENTKVKHITGVVKSKIDTSNTQEVIYSVGGTYLYGEDEDAEILNLVEKPIDVRVYYKDEVKENNILIDYKLSDNTD